ncbi:hypothetical protein [Pseudoblastomonas halimionae]|uniref:Uncharacterized protein n=1 Tax=Alteriqipengyuania halimionae TaxID=1926630 RepID=A0A6I4U1N9_9SPHN|nr:hypothetical protein [Alteriqipengyuania halimionae]MXP09636.1 hypothetical protein [Alteriqipengyuania halimionae]
MIHCFTRQYDDLYTGRRKTRVFFFEADTQEDYQATLGEILRMPLPGIPVDDDEEGEQ